MTTAPGVEGITWARFLQAALTDPALDLATLLGAPVAERLWEGAAPVGTPAPWIVWQLIPDPLDVKVVGNVQVMARAQVQVKVIGQGASYTPVMSVYQAIHERLESKTNEPTTLGYVLSCHRVSGVQYPERVNGIEYRHLGGLYEALIQ